MIEDRALERLLEQARQVEREDPPRRPLTAALAERAFGAAWDDPDHVHPHPDIDPPDVLWRASDEDGGAA